MNLKVFKIEMSGYQCCLPECEHSPKYHHNMRIGKFDHFSIKEGTICLKLNLGSASEYYCYDCIDKVYAKFKKVMNKSLWPFQ